MWTYRQSSGQLRRDDGVLIATGYAGHGAGKNNPEWQNIPNMGPLPCGFYDIDPEPFTHPKCGPFCLRLTPDPANEMFGRAGFLFHGDSINQPGTASEGCIIQARSIREKVAGSKDYRLQVVSGLDPADSKATVS